MDIPTKPYINPKVTQIVYFRDSEANPAVLQANEWLKGHTYCTIKDIRFERAKPYVDKMMPDRGTVDIYIIYETRMRLDEDKGSEP